MLSIDSKRNFQQSIGDAQGFTLITAFSTGIRSRLFCMASAAFLVETLLYERRNDVQKRGRLSVPVLMEQVEWKRGTTDITAQTSTKRIHHNAKSS